MVFIESTSTNSNSNVIIFFPLKKLLLSEKPCSCKIQMTVIIAISQQNILTLHYYVCALIGSLFKIGQVTIVIFGTIPNYRLYYDYYFCLLCLLMDQRLKRKHNFNVHKYVKYVKFLSFKSSAAMKKNCSCSCK